MIARLCAVATFALACACASAQAVVELVPDPPGPYLPGQPITIHVWLHNQMGAGYEAWLRLVQFDFSQSSSAVLSNLTFAFDYTSVPGGDWGYEERHPSLPVPWTYNGLECVCPDIFFFLPAYGHLHVGSLTGVLPDSEGNYQLEALNAPFPIAFPWGTGGAILGLTSFAINYLGASVEPQLTNDLYYDLWSAFEGELTGAPLSLVVVQPTIPALSPTLAVVLGGLLIGAGVVVTKRR